jgi:triacylglycerol lipase
MRPQLRAQLQALGPELTPAMLQQSTALMAGIAAPRDATVEILRDRQYGPDARNRLDVFRRGAPAGAPVLVYVHGGGFVMGDKTREGSPFYDNVGQWAAQQGWIGVTVTYRLAPANRWPSGPEDMALAVRWLRANIAEHGGDPERIILMGQSAGGAHVAAYVAHGRFHDGATPGIAGAVMISGIYDAATQPANAYSDAYFGEGAGARAGARCIDGLLASSVPLLFTVSEFDPRDFQEQAMQLARAWHERKGCYPPLEYLAGHNHLSPAQTLGSDEGQMAQRLADFVAVISAARGLP